MMVLSDSQRFVGVWQLVSVVFRPPDGPPNYLYGDAPTGLISYSRNGLMWVQIMAAGRPHLPRSASATNALKDYQAILKGYVAYWGRYTVDEIARTMTHHVVGSLVAEWVGTDLVRGYEFSGDKFYLRTAPAAMRGVMMSGELVWGKTTFSPP